MRYEQILCDVKDRILTITLNRPEKLNAATFRMADEMIDALGEANRDDEIRVVVFTGAGEAFCAGADLTAGASTFDYAKKAGQRAPNGDQAGQPDWSDERIRDSGGRLTLAMFDCLKPLIAAVNGSAVGIGATMLLPMDFRLASEKARFGFVFSKLGIVPEGASSWFLPKLVGVSQALDWCLSGRLFDAKEALQGGLVKEVVEHDQLLARAYGLASEIRDKTSPVSVALIRQMLWRLSGHDHPMEAHKIDSRAVYSRGSSRDVAEGVNAFLDKRKANFPDKVSTDMPSYFPWWTEHHYS